MESHSINEVEGAEEGGAAGELRPGWTCSSRPPGEGRTIPQLVDVFARGAFDAGVESKMAAMASRLPVASRSISSRAA